MDQIKQRCFDRLYVLRLTTKKYVSMRIKNGRKFSKPGNKISRKRSFRLGVVYAVLNLHKLLFVSLKCFCLIRRNFLPVQSKEDHF